jgi:hypothetical protein
MQLLIGANELAHVLAGTAIARPAAICPSTNSLSGSGREMFKLCIEGIQNHIPFSAAK